MEKIFSSSFLLKKIFSELSFERNNLLTDSPTERINLFTELSHNRDQNIDAVSKVILKRLRDQTINVTCKVILISSEIKTINYTKRVILLRLTTW